MDAADPDRPPHKFKARKKDLKRLHKKHGMRFVPTYGERLYYDKENDEKIATHQTSKIPFLGKSWQEKLVGWEAAANHVRDGGHLGGMPRHMTPPHFVADVDKGGKDAVLQVVRRLGKPRAIYKTFTPDRFHLWYACSEAGDLPDGGDMIINGMALGEVKINNTILANVAKLLKGLEKRNAKPIPIDKVREELVLNIRKSYGEPIYLKGEKVLRSNSLQQAINDFPPEIGARRPELFKLACWCGRRNDKEALDRLIQKAIEAGIPGGSDDLKRQAINGWNRGQENAASGIGMKVSFNRF